MQPRMAAMIVAFAIVLALEGYSKEQCDKCCSCDALPMVHQLSAKMAPGEVAFGASARAARGHLDYLALGTSVLLAVR